MKYVIYSASKDNKYETILLNAVSGEVVWRGPAIGSPSSTNGVAFPVWRPRSEVATLILHSSTTSDDENFYSLYDNGTLQKTTQFDEVINPPYNLRTPTWSQDGHYLAFTVWSGSIYTLYIFDSFEGKLINTCLTTDVSKTNYNSLWNEMIWSPTGEYLAVFKPAGESNFDIFILDIQHEVIYLVPYTTERLGLTSLLGWIDWEIP
jgi:hypothetical protein